MEPIDEERNPLKWYKEHKDEFPLTTSVYIRLASIQATSVPPAHNAYEQY